MQEKQCLFYEKQSLGEFWKNSMLAEKIFLVCWSINAVLMAIIFAVLISMSTDRETAVVLFTLSWVLLFPGLLWISHRSVKGFWVILGNEDVLRHGFYGTLKQRKKIRYEEVAYILTGELEPFVTPRPNLGPWYHRKFGNYLNVLDAQKNCLFTVRYSKENLNLLMEKCIHAQLMDIETYRTKEKNN